MIDRLLVFLFCFGVSLPAYRAQMIADQPTDPGSIALRLQSRQRVAGIDYETQLAAAERDFAREDYAATSARLKDLSARTFLDSRAIELTYYVQRATGQDSAAVGTLREGLQTYPHAVRLLRIAPTEAALRGELSEEDVVTDRRYPDALEAELKALLAFRQNLPATGLLEAERATYQYMGRNELGAPTKQAVAKEYARLLSDSLSAKQTTEPAAASGQTGASFEDVYASAFLSAATRLRESPLDSLGPLAQAAKLRAVALRLFVRDGGLARWPDPMLVDLYVLDRAGHLETAGLLQLSWMAPAELAALQTTSPTRFLRARTYIAEDWRDASDAWQRN